MKKIVTTFLAGILSFALFLPAGCVKRPVEVPNYGKYSNRFDSNDEKLYNKQEKYEETMKIIEQGKPNKITIIENNEEIEVEIYPYLIEVTLKKASGYPILSMNDIFGNIVKTDDANIKKFYYILSTPNDVSKEERYDGYENDFRQKVAFELKVPTKYVILEVFSVLMESSIIKDINLVSIY